MSGHHWQLLNRDKPLLRKGGSCGHSSDRDPFGHSFARPPRFFSKPHHHSPPAGFVRKIRVVCCDPDATDDSSDEDGFLGGTVNEGTVGSLKSKKNKLILCEIIHVLPSTPITATADTSSAFTRVPKGKRKLSESPGSTSGKTGPKYRRVRQRRRRKRATETGGPSKGVRVRLGSYDTAEAAAATESGRGLDRVDTEKESLASSCSAPASPSSAFAGMSEPPLLSSSPLCVLHPSPGAAAEVGELAGLELMESFLLVEQVDELGLFAGGLGDLDGMDFDLDPGWMDWMDFRSDAGIVV